MTTPPEGDSAGMRDYHHGLAQHLLDLIRKTTSGSASATTSTGPATYQSKKQSITPPPPANPRQHSGSSMESDSRVSSGQTTESRRSNADAHATNNDAEEDADEYVATFQKGARRGSDDAEGLNRVDGDEEYTSSEPHDLTARPDCHPARFSPLPTFHIASDEHDTTQVAEFSASGAMRYARSPQSPTESPNSPRHRSSLKTGATARVPRPRYVTHPSSHAETLTREAEHRKAWETDGKRVWRNIPAGFELKLVKKPRSGSNESSSVDLSGAQSIHSGISGAGPGTAMRPDDVFVPDLLDVDTKDCEMVSSNEHTTRDTASEMSKPEIQSDSSVSMSVAKPTIKRTSTLQRRQAMVEAQAKAEAHAHAQEQAKLYSAAQQLADDPAQLDHNGDRNLRSAEQEAVSGTDGAQSEDEQEEYLRKRQMRLRKKEYVLKKRIGKWWQDVLESHGGQLNGYHRDNFHREGDMPEIEPHIPSPKLDSSMLRFPPLPSATSLLEDSDGSSTVLRLPSLQLIEDGRKHKSLTFAPPHRGESDVDLLIRLTEMSRVSSASGSGSARGVSLGPGLGSRVDRTIFPLSAPRLLP